MRMSVLWVFLAAEGALLAQIDRSPVPFPGGQTGPLGVPGIPLPFPRRGGQGPAGRGGHEEATTRTSGKLSKIDDKSIVVDSSDARVLEFRRDRSTKFFKQSKEVSASELKIGDEVSVEATTDQRGYMLAKSVYWEGSASEKSDKPETAGADTTQPSPSLPPAQRDPDDPGPPTLRRGAPPPQATSEGRAEEVPASAPVTTTGPRKPADTLIEKAREAAATFSEGLPDYVCKEYMARYASSSRPTDWQALDVVSTDVVYEKGHESYRNVTINGKAVNKSIEQLDGAWSTGEFASMLLDLLSPATAADFRFSRQGFTAGITARVYDFEVQQPNSHWHVQVASQSINPAYRGSVWIDPASGRVLRIEIQARSLPKAFPADTVESAVDYGQVRVGGKEFFLPVHAESLSCQRGSPNCSRNSLDFRNYHKYEADSSIAFGPSNQ